ncbi:MAG: AAA family ATPase [Candidatus Limiplasma sp.]|nr:AAA family ATPase [Candidatus Limiplasma sp.]
MTIKTLEIIAFKGIQHLLLEPDGHNAVISGRNGTGKTSVCDAFLWLLFGKDSAGNKADVKPRNNLGERVEGLESDVRAVLTVDARDIELRRQWHEVWSKDPASGEKVYSRDETLCWIDGVPVKLEKEYTPYVLGLVGGDENTFKLLTDLGAFMRLNWADRRRELVKIAGGDPDAELRTREEYRNIDDILRGASPEDAKKRLLEQRRTLETELKTLPARIDELEKTMQPVTDAEVAEARKAIAALQAELDDAEALLTVAPETLKRANNLYARKRELETRRAEIERSLRQPIDEALSAAEGKLATIRRTEASLASDQLIALDELRRLQLTLAQVKDQREAKLAEWHNYDSLTYLPPDIGTVCPTCGQPLPAGQVQDACEKHRADWDAKRLASMEMVRADGVKLADRIKTVTESIAAAQVRLATLEAQIANLPDKQALVAEIKALEAACPEPAGNAAWQAVTAEIAEADKEIAQHGNSSRSAELAQRKAEIRERMQPHELVISRQELTRSVQARIEVLQSQKREAGAKIARVEGAIDLLARYVRERCAALEENINRLFRTIRWRLFEFAKNGSLIDCCDATVDGIAYIPGGNELNTGACVNADIEIIHVLSQAYGVTAPCFVDNAERVNRVGFPGGQRILLRVSEADTLTIMKEE